MSRLRALTAASFAAAGLYAGVSGMNVRSPLYRAVIPALHQLDAETSHAFSIWLASNGVVPRDTAQDPPALAVTVRTRH